MTTTMEGEPMDTDLRAAHFLGPDAIRVAEDERGAMVRASYLLTLGHPARAVAVYLMCWAYAHPELLGTAPEILEPEPEPEVLDLGALRRAMRERRERYAGVPYNDLGPF